MAMMFAAAPSSSALASIAVLPTSVTSQTQLDHLDPGRSRWEGASSSITARNCVESSFRFYGVRRKLDQGSRFSPGLEDLESSSSCCTPSSRRCLARQQQSHGGGWRWRVRANGDDIVSEGVSKTALRPFSRAWFIDAYHQSKAWPEVHKILSGRNVQSVSWREAYDMAKSGAATLIDVREAQDFERVHGQGSFSAPLFRLIEGDDFKANLRRFGYALLTDFAGTERNPNFIKQASQAVGDDKEKLVIVLCEIGGTLSTFVERKGPKAKKFADPERRFGRASRSLKALYEMQEAGFKTVMYLEGGLNSWIHEDLPLAGTAT